MMMMVMCKRLAQVPMLCVPIYNIKLAMMQKLPFFFTTFSAHTKMAADKRGQKVFARSSALRPVFSKTLANSFKAFPQKRQSRSEV